MSALFGCSIAVAGKFPGYTQAKLKVLITKNGGNFEASGVTSSCTHLITPPQVAGGVSDKWHTARAKDIPVVGLEWLIDSVEEGKKLDEKPYLHKDIADSEPKDNDSKKRKGDESEELNEKSPKKLRGRIAREEIEESKEQDNVTDETVEDKGVEQGYKGRRGRSKVINPEIQEPANEVIETKDSERADDQKEPTKKRGRPARKTAKDEETVESNEEPAKQPLKKRGRIAKGIIKAEVEEEVTTAKIVEPASDEKEIKEREMLVKKATKSGPKTSTEVDTEETPAPIKEADQPERKQTMLAIKPKDSVKKKNVPVDSACPLRNSHNVYIDPSGTPYDASLNQSDIGRNNNKFYNIQLLESNDGAKYATWTHWGRVGESGQNALFDNQTLEGAMKIFETKFKDKSGLKWKDRYNEPKAKKYAVIEKNYMDESEDENDIKGKKKEKKTEDKLTASSKLSPELQSLMQLIFNPGYIASSMAAMRYDANKLPLGKLSKKTLSQGFMVLKDLAEIVTSPGLAQSKYNMPLNEVLNDLTSKYYTVIPHDFGRQRPPVISNEEILKKEVELVETLGDMEIANEIMKDAEYSVDTDGNPIHHLDKQFQSLDLEEATLVDKSTTEFIELEAYLRKSQKDYTTAKLIDVFRITRPGEANRFEEGGYSADKVKAHNVNDARKLLWHGSRSTNFGGILSQGLRIAPPEAPVNGYAFGKGVYLADLASKSCEYVYPYTSGNQGLLLLCEAQLGDPVYERYNHDPNAASNSKKKGSLSTWAQGKTQPKEWKDAGAISEELKGVMMPDVDTGLINPKNMPPSSWIPDNEYIVYSVSQVKLRYLFRDSQFF